jgi:hypothetical protein
MMMNERSTTTGEKDGWNDGINAGSRASCKKISCAIKQEGFDTAGKATVQACYQEVWCDMTHTAIHPKQQLATVITQPTEPGTEVVAERSFW